jgi:hypothetical protein
MLPGKGGAMELRSIFEHVRDRTTGNERRRAVTAAVVTALAFSLAVTLAAMLNDDSGEHRSVSGPTPTATPGGPWVKLDLPPEDNRFVLHATSEDGAGVRTDSQFVFTSTEAMSAKALGERLRVEPTLDFELKQVSDGEVRIEPRAPLAEGELYRFTLLAEDNERTARAWAFQAQAPLRVVQTLPGDQTSDVPLDTGIELTFNHDGVAGYEQLFSIDPPVEGRFEQHKRVVVFVPTALQPETLYTVTLGAGAKISGSETAMAADHVVRFETGATNRDPSAGYATVMAFSRRTFEMPTDEPPVLAMFTSAQGTQISASFTVYRFAGAPEFVKTLRDLDSVPQWARFTRDRFHVDASGLSQVATFQGALEPIGQYGDLYVRFPDRLPEGFYLVDARYNDARAQGWLQITDVATYTSVSGERLLIWANDLRTQAPLAGASVELADGTQTGATMDEQGVAFFDTPAGLIDLQPSPFGYSTTQPASDLIVRAADGRLAVVPLGNVFNGYKYYGFREYFYQGDPAPYWRFFYSDRNLYLPTDSVHFWGIARPRDGQPGERELTVRITGSTYDGDYRPTEVAETTVKTLPSGTYIGELPIVDVSPGYYNLSVSIDGQAVGGSYFEVRDYVKPAYRIEVTPSKRAVVLGDSVEYAINASFFEGSPLPNLALTYSGTEAGETTTDAGGTASVTQRATSEYAQHFSVAPKLAEEGEITGGATVRTFPSELTIDVESDIASGSARVNGTVYNIDFARLNGDQASPYEDPRGSRAASRTVTGAAQELNYIREEIGEAYNFISKRVEKLYNYREMETPLGQFTATSGADGSFLMSWPADPEKNYRLKLSVTDDRGRTFSTDAYVYSRGNVYFQNQVYVGDAREAVYYGFGGDSAYATGEQVTVALRQGSDELPSGGANRYLFYHAQLGIREYAVQNEAHHSFTFDADDVPGVSIMGVRFTGETYQEASFPYLARFNPEERELRIHVEPDSERYVPGDDATLRVTTTDRDGVPVAAEVLLSAVDEAVFVLEDSYSDYQRDILTALYTPLSSGILRTYASHFYPFENPQAERGGDGGPRSDFKDVALFERVQTDSDGKASITFKLPDNLTSWRITAVGVSDLALAGHSLTLAPVGLPFFVDVAINRDYLASDRPSIRLRALGSELRDGDEVTFAVSSESLGIDEPVEAVGQGFGAVDIAFPELREGTHDLLIEASSGNRKDSLIRTINVVPSRLVRTEARFYELAADTQLEGSGDRGTTVVFSDQNRGRYYPLLQQLSWGYGDRVDQMLARNLAQELLRDQFADEGFSEPAEFLASAYQTPDGGIALFPYGGGDLLLSARMADVAADRFGRQTLTAYFQRIVDDEKETRERAIIATYGLASLGEPMLLDVRAIAGLPDLTWRERLYAGLAAGALGDEEMARRVYRGLLDEYGQRRGPWVRINPGGDEDDILEATSLLAILAAHLGDDLAPDIFGYTQDNYTRDMLVQLEQISYLRRVLPRLPAEPVRVAYRVDRKRKEAKLERGDSLTLRLTPAQLRDLQPEAIEGNAGVSTFFLAPFEASGITVDPAVSVRRRIEAVDGGTIADGKLVRVTLDWEITAQAVDGCYQVSDLLPSGLRPVTRVYRWLPDATSASYPYAVQGQRVSFCVYKTPPPYYRPLVYYARVLGKGAYLAEPAIIQSQKAAESINLTPGERIEIR